MSCRDHLRNFMKTDLKAWDGCNPVHLAAKNGVVGLFALIDIGVREASSRKRIS